MSSANLSQRTMLGPAEYLKYAEEFFRTMSSSWPSDFVESTNHTKQSSLLPQSYTIMIRPASQRVVSIQELLVSIFEHSAPQELARCTRVCKHWYRLANRALWKDVPLSSLYNILAPTRYEAGGYLSSPCKVG